MAKKTILLLIICLSGLLLSFLLYWFKARNLTPPLPSAENTTTSTTLTTTTTHQEILKDLKQIQGIVDVNNNKLSYFLIRIGQINEKGVETQLYDIELKDNSKTKISEDSILKISREIVEKVLIIEPDVTKINLFFFSDKSLIETSPPDLGYVVWDKENNDFSYQLIRANIKPSE